MRARAEASGVIWVLRILHASLPSVIDLGFRQLRVRPGAAPLIYDAATITLAVAAGGGARGRFLAAAPIAAGLVVLNDRSGRPTTTALLVATTACVAASEEVIWRRARPRSVLGAVASCCGFGLLHRRDGLAAVRYHVVTGGILAFLATRIGLVASIGAHAAHNLAIDALSRRPAPVTSVPDVPVAHPWPGEPSPEWVPS